MAERGYPTLSAFGIVTVVFPNGTRTRLELGASAFYTRFHASPFREFHRAVGQRQLGIKLLPGGDLRARVRLLMKREPGTG